MLGSSGNRILLNLASNEYFKAIDISQLNAEIITIDFKEYKAGKYTTIGLFAKRARGMMARYIIQKRLTTLAELKKFAIDNYSFNADLSEDKLLVFTRRKK